MTDSTVTVPMIVLLVLPVLLAVAFFAVSRGKGKLILKSVWASLRMEGSNDPAAGVRGKKLKAGGKIEASSNTEKGVDVEDADAAGDILLKHNAPPGTRSPKA